MARTKKNNSMNIEMKSTLEGLISISENKIKMFHEKSGTQSYVGLDERQPFLQAVRKEEVQQVTKLSRTTSKYNPHLFF